ncbi:hypothetical protein, partial [Streptomyces glaucescens]|uniref:hypothetical protein n=1 Tax=Streptomyces glaucescens TaxID=1907 RepID=UPI00117CED62
MRPLYVPVRLAATLLAVTAAAGCMSVGDDDGGRAEPSHSAGPEGGEAPGGFPAVTGGGAGYQGVAAGEADRAGGKGKGKGKGGGKGRGKGDAAGVSAAPSASAPDGGGATVAPPGGPGQTAGPGGGGPGSTPAHPAPTRTTQPPE